MGFTHSLLVLLLLVCLVHHSKGVQLASTTATLRHRSRAHERDYDFGGQDSYQEDEDGDMDMRAQDERDEEEGGGRYSRGESNGDYYNGEGDDQNDMDNFHGGDMRGGGEMMGEDEDQDGGDFRFAEHRVGDSARSTHGVTYETVDDLVAPSNLPLPGQKDHSMNKYLPRFMQTSLADTIMDAAGVRTDSTSTLGEADTEASTINVDEAQLDTAFNEISDEIVRQANEIKREEEWNKKVDSLIKSYTTKKENVKTNIKKLSDKLKKLIKNKRQIMNLKLQTQLESKKKVAAEDMKTLEAALKHVKTKQASFTKTKESLQSTIDKLTSALSSLRGADKKGGKDGGKGDDSKSGKGGDDTSSGSSGDDSSASSKDDSGGSGGDDSSSKDSSGGKASMF